MAFPTACTRALIAFLDTTVWHVLNDNLVAAHLTNRRTLTRAAALHSSRHRTHHTLHRIKNFSRQGLHNGHNIVDLEDHPHALRGQLERAGVHEHWLDDVLCVHVTDGSLAHVYACIQ